MGRVAFITGGNGITGSYLVEFLLSERAPAFDKIIATSRRAPNPDWVSKDLPAGSLGKKLVWVEADLLGASVDELAAKFKEGGVGEATHLYWGAYYFPKEGWGSKEETEANELMFDKCLRATLACTKKLDRVLLQLGAKWHVRDPFPQLPFREEDSPPNVPLAPFYNAQLEIAKKLAREHGFSWTVTLPLAVIGATRQTAMTLATSLAVYILTLKTLGMPPIFPGSAALWNSVQDCTAADILAELNVWASLEPGAAGQILNAHNGDVFSYRVLWPKWCAYFGYPRDQLILGDDMEPHLTKEKGKLTVSAVQQITEDMAREAWAKIAAADPSVAPDGYRAGWESFWFVDAQLGFEINLVYSPTKLRKLGWNGYRDTEESFFDVFDRLRKDGVLPKGLPGREAAKDLFPW
ncbi:hypothetical protein DFJ74DRAFT_661387 [Hyaloraphidium curvatum]|nr:hypothetical protein DFJ74DRAFT_661387 [Hyaloraphidium curvatum]